MVIHLWGHARGDCVLDVSLLSGFRWAPMGAETIVRRSIDIMNGERPASRRQEHDVGCILPGDGGEGGEWTFSASVETVNVLSFSLGSPCSNSPLFHHMHVRLHSCMHSCEDQIKSICNNTTYATYLQYSTAQRSRECDVAPHSSNAVHPANFIYFLMWLYRRKLGSMCITGSCPDPGTRTVLWLVEDLRSARPQTILGYMLLLRSRSLR